MTKVSGDADKSLAYIRKGIREFRLWALLMDDFDEPYDIYIKPNFNTAAWRFDRSKNRHQFFIGEQAVLDAPDEKTAIEKVVKLGRHERSHAQRTGRNLKAIEYAIEYAIESSTVPGLQFEDFNLIEDAAIEAQDTLKTGTPYNWLEVEKQEEAETPRQLFFNYIQADGSPDVLIKADRLPAADIVDVRNFYERATKAEDSWARFEIAKEFVLRFPPSPEEKARGGGKGLQDLKLSSDLNDSPEKAEQFLEDCKGEKNEKERSGSGLDPDTKADSSFDSESSTGELLGKKGNSLPLSRSLDSLVSKLKASLSVKKKERLSDKASKRLDVRELVLGGDKVYNHRIVPRPVKRHVELVVDLSGSMSGVPSQGARDFIFILSELAKGGFVKGRVIFTAESRSNSPIRETYRLPMPVQKIEQVEGWGGGEGIEATLRAEASKLSKADMVLVYTDAQISDAPVDKAVLHKKGIFTTALYVGNSNACEDMLTYFDKSIARDSVEKLVDAFVGFLRHG